MADTSEILRRLEKLQADMDRNCHLTKQTHECLMGDIREPSKLGLVPRVENLERSQARMTKGFFTLLMAFLAAAGKTAWDKLTKGNA